MARVRVGVSGVLAEEGRVLLVRHTYSGRYGVGKDRWWVPGGYVRPDETLGQAVVRELKEETGLEVRPLGVMAVRTRPADVVVAFLVERTGGRLSLEDPEVAEVRLFSQAELHAARDVMNLSRELALAALARRSGLLGPHPFRPAGLGPEDYVLYL